MSLLITAAACSIGVAASCGSFGGSDTSGGGDGDGGPADASAADTSATDGSHPDALAEDAAAPFCPQAGASFCADFEQGAFAQSGFMPYVAGPGSADIDDAGVFGSVHSLRSTIMGQQGLYDAAAPPPNGLAMGRVAVNVGSRRFSFDADVRIDGYPSNTVDGGGQYTTILNIQDSAQADEKVALIVSPGDVALFVSNPGLMYHAADAALPKKAFHLRVDVDAVAGTTSLHVNGQPYIAATAPGIITSSTEFIFEVGMYAQPALSNGGVHFDNVVVRAE